ncbi:hypothetical protein ACJX0J_020915, partial [Zea mays]
EAPTIFVFTITHLAIVILFSQCIYYKSIPDYCKLGGSKFYDLETNAKNLHIHMLTRKRPIFILYKDGTKTYHHGLNPLLLRADGIEGDRVDAATGVQYITAQYNLALIY